MVFVYFLMTAAIGTFAPTIIKIWFKPKMDWSMVIGTTAFAFLIPMFIFIGVTMSSFHDTEIWNGQVTDKKMVEVSCSHSYDCHCYYTTDTHRNSDGSTYTTQTRHCQTCYEHDEDYDWRVYTTLGTIEIDRIDRQGTGQPPRWTIVKKGEPVADKRSYTNYIKGSVDSLFHLKELKLNYTYPPYPEVTDYYRFNRVINHGGVGAAFATDLNNRLNLALREMGAKKQVNIIVHFTNNKDPNYGEGMRRHWQNGKKNDVVVIVGVQAGKPLWAKVFSLSQSNLVNIQIRDDIQRLDLLKDSEGFANILITRINESFQRKRMRDFEYLKYNYSISIWVIAVSFFISTFIGIFGTLLLWRHEQKLYGHYYR